MIAKTPDYFIAECGRPQWATTTSDKKTNKEDCSLFKSFKIISNEANKRLLPLRETLTDYYAQVVAAKLEAWNKTTSKTNKQENVRQQQQQQKQPKETKQQKPQHRQPQQQDDDPAQLKLLKMQRNEAVKKKWQQNGPHDRHQSEQHRYHQPSCENNNHHYHRYLHPRQEEFNRDRPNHFDTGESQHCLNTNAIKRKTLRKTTKTTTTTLDNDLDVF